MKFRVGQLVSFKVDHKEGEVTSIPEFYCNDDTNRHVIHGDAVFKQNKGRIMEIIKHKYILVEFIGGLNNEPVRLPFLEEDLQRYNKFLPLSKDDKHKIDSILESIKNIKII